MLVLMLSMLLHTGPTTTSTVSPDIMVSPGIKFHDLAPHYSLPTNEDLDELPVRLEVSTPARS